MSELQRLIDANRLVTVTGTGGVGKTRLAIQTAAARLDRHRHGIWMVDLSAIADPALVPHAVANALGFPQQSNRALSETLLGQIQGRNLLLLLDNCEHVARPTAALVALLLRSCPDLKVVATSREPLNVAGEVNFQLPPLPAPPLDVAVSDLAGGFEAVDLFVDRARLISPSAGWDAREMSEIARICSQLDGLPLAIELAAARMNVLSPSEIVQRLDRRLELLTRGDSTAPARSQTLRATLDWSFGLLSQQAQLLLRRLSVFTGSFSLDAVQGVAAFVPLEPETVFDVLCELVEKSMVLVQPPSSDATRYRLLETIRQYGRELLQASAEESVVCERHCEWFVQLVEEADPRLYSRDQVQWLQRLELELGNIRSALAFSHDKPDAGATMLRLTNGLGWFWFLHGQMSEGRRWLDSAITSSSSPVASSLAAAFLWRGLMDYGQGDIVHSAEWDHKAIAAAEAQGDDLTLSRALNHLAFAERDRNQLTEALTTIDRALAVATASDFRWETAWNLYTKGTVLDRRSAGIESSWSFFEESFRRFKELGDRLGLSCCLHALSGRFEHTDPEQMAALNRDALAMCREIGHRRGVCLSLTNLGIAARNQGDASGAIEHFRQSLRQWHELGDRRRAADQMASLASALSAEQSKVAAVRVLAASDRILEATGGPLNAVFRADIGYDRIVSSSRDALGKQRFDAQWAIGDKLSFDEAVEYALTCPITAERGSRETDDANPLSRREREVAAFLGRGLTNKEIARELFLSKQTVDRHVSNILTKLGMERRSQIVAWLSEQRTKSAPHA